MRIRSIKPEFWRSDDIDPLDWDARLLFIGLWSYVDDNGVGLDKISSVVSDLFSADHMRDSRETVARVTGGLLALTERGLISRYHVAGKHFLHITKWAQHQRIDKPNKPRYPLPDAENAVIRESVASVSRESSAWSRGTEEQGNRGTEEQRKEPLSLNATDRAEAIELFDYAYSHWPKKVKREEALEKFKAVIKSERPVVIAEAIQVFGDAYAATTQKQFIPALGVWLNQKRWTDELPTAPDSGKPTPSDKTMAILDMGRRMQAESDLRELTA
jgi:hypothetical protein